MPDTDQTDDSLQIHPPQSIAEKTEIAAREQQKANELLGNLKAAYEHHDQKRARDLVEKLYADYQRRFTKIAWETARQNYPKEYSPTPQDIEEVVQDTCYKICRNILDFKETGNGLSWMTTICRNAAHDYLRKKVRRPPSQPATIPEDAYIVEDADPQVQITEQELKGALSLTFGLLSEDERSILKRGPGSTETEQTAYREAVERAKEIFSHIYGQDWKEGR